LGNPDEFKILELAETIVSLTANRSQIVFKHPPQDDPFQRQLNITLAKQWLD